MGRKSGGVKCGLYSAVYNLCGFCGLLCPVPIWGTGDAPPRKGVAPSGVFGGSVLLYSMRHFCTFLYLYSSSSHPIVNIHQPPYPIYIYI